MPPLQGISSYFRFKVQGFRDLGLRVQGLGFRFKGSGFEWFKGFRVEGVGLKGLRVYCSLAASKD